jgi:CRISPR/Cas system-associated exonuclease Cas4 (RecB family)
MTRERAEKSIRLSASSLGLYLECPRCFWLEQVARIHRPSGPFPSLPGGMDNVIKKYFDRYRSDAASGLPPEIMGRVPGKLLQDAELLRKWRNWRTGLVYDDPKNNAILIGALDDCLVDEDGAYIPLDYKTRGYPLKEDSTSYYQHQLDAYTFLLSENGYKTNGTAYLVYYHPLEASEGGMVRFEVTVKMVKTDKDRAKKLFNDAVSVLRSDIPPRHSACEFCSFGEHQHEII